MPRPWLLGEYPHACANGPLTHDPRHLFSLTYPGEIIGKSGVITRRASSRGAVSVRGFRGPVSVEIEEIAKRFAFVLDEMVGFHQRVWKA